MSVILATLLSFTIYRSGSLTEYSRILTQSGTMAATILIIMAATSVLSYILSYEQIPKAITTNYTFRYIADCFHTRCESLTFGPGLLFRDHIGHIDCCTNIASNTQRLGHRPNLFWNNFNREYGTGRNHSANWNEFVRSKRNI